MNTRMIPVCPGLPRETSVEEWATGAACVVCFGEYLPGDDLCRLPCRHTYHAEVNRKTTSEASRQCTRPPIIKGRPLWSWAKTRAVIQGRGAASMFTTTYFTVYDGVYHTPLGPIFLCSISPHLEYCRCQRGRRWKILAESFLKTHRSVLASSWLPSNRNRKTAPGGCDGAMM